MYDEWLDKCDGDEAVLNGKLKNMHDSHSSFGRTVKTRAKYQGVADAFVQGIPEEDLRRIVRIKTPFTALAEATKLAGKHLPAGILSDIGVGKWANNIRPLIESELDREHKSIQYCQHLTPSTPPDTQDNSELVGEIVYVSDA